MTILSEYEEDQKSASSSSASWTLFSANFDASNPLGFLEEVVDFLAKKSDFFEKDSAKKKLQRDFLLRFSIEDLGNFLGGQICEVALEFSFDPNSTKFILLERERERERKKMNIFRLAGDVSHLMSVVVFSSSDPHHQILCWWSLSLQVSIICWPFLYRYISWTVCLCFIPASVLYRYHLYCVARMWKDLCLL